MLTFKKLLDSFGKNLQDQPFYRLVWSSSQTEWRRGEFNDFYGNLYLRTVVGERLCPKYPFNPDRWILEKWIPPEKAFNPELPNSRQGSYEPLFVFEDKNRNPLPVTNKVLEFIIAQDRAPRVSVGQRTLELINLEKMREEKEIADFVDAIDTSPIQSALHSREAIGYDRGLKDA